jgi:thiol-disulfide isomerase/thioredoxin/Tfp pilus assembly protein PilF
MLFSLLSTAAIHANQTKAGDRAGDLVEQGKQAYLQGHFIKSKDLFLQATTISPQNAEALYGYARSAHELHLYGEAIAAYEKALKLSPDNITVLEDYISALAWGGTLKDDRRMLEKARDKGLTTLASRPDRVGFYRSVSTTAEKLNEVPGFLRSLESLAERLPQSPVLAIQIQELRLRLAQGKKNQQETDRIKNAIRSDLASVNLDSISKGGLTAPQLYKIATGYRLIGEQEKYAAAFDALVRAPQGMLLARHIPLPYWPGMMALFTNRDLKKEDLKERLGKIRKTKDCLAPTWQLGHAGNILLEMEFDTLAEMARQRYSAPDAKPAADAPEVNLDSLIALGERMANLNTWGGANWYVKTAQLLLDLDVRMEDAIRISAWGIKALEARQPGLIYPGSGEQETENSYLQLIARLKVAQAEAMEKTGQAAQAEKLLREAVKDSPSARTYSAMGRLLLAKGETEDAYDNLVSALAKGPQKGSPLEKQTRDATAKAAEVMKRSEATVAEDIKNRQQKFALEEERMLVGSRLNEPAATFELKDMTGKTWRLKDLRGKVVVLNYWATWCGPCVAELPHYQKLVKGYANSNDVVFLAISIDDDAEAVRSWLEKNKYDVTVLHDKGSSIDYKVNGVPTSLVIGPDGNIAYRTTGFPGEEKYLKEMRLRIEALRVK